MSVSRPPRPPYICKGHRIRLVVTITDDETELRGCVVETKYYDRKSTGPERQVAHDICNAINKTVREGGPPP